MEYNVVVHWRTAQFRAPASLKEVSPLGKASIVRSEPATSPSPYRASSPTKSKSMERAQV